MAVQWCWGFWTALQVLWERTSQAYSHYRYGISHFPEKLKGCYVDAEIVAGFAPSHFGWLADFLKLSGYLETSPWTRQSRGWNLQTERLGLQVREFGQWCSFFNTCRWFEDVWGSHWEVSSCKLFYGFFATREDWSHLWSWVISVSYGFDPVERSMRLFGKVLFCDGLIPYCFCSRRAA